MDAAITRHVWQRSKNCCEYCQMSQEFDDTTFGDRPHHRRKHGGLYGCKQPGSQLILL